jgi:mitogen-activated protein kinase 1/3
MPLSETKSVVVDPKITYVVPEHLEFIRKVGSGAYGTVVSFKDPLTGMYANPLPQISKLDHKYAVKKIQSAFDDLIDAKRILREIRLLRHFSHDNIIRILDMYPPPVCTIYAHVQSRM